MKAKPLHSWQVSIAQAQDIQRQLAGQVSRTNHLDNPQLIAGVDISAERAGEARAAVVVLRFPQLALAEVRVAQGRPSFPYVPGLLSFRESPLIIAAWEKLELIPDLLLVDGQGLAHPRRFGLASHLGLLLDTPAIGCAKSVLCGQHGPVGEGPGSYAELIDGGEVVGAALRTKLGQRPIIVSIGHKVDLPTAMDWVLRCCKGQRMPEPTRLAHEAAAGQLKEGLSEVKLQERVEQGRLL
ncbi:MAG TPA: deoxyribonuclease V [Dehalococcoidia bacterium]|nr:deoxyribonuclease V [Dehalococcoidia bacterium]